MYLACFLKPLIHRMASSSSDIAERGYKMQGCAFGKQAIIHLSPARNERASLHFEQARQTCIATDFSAHKGGSPASRFLHIHVNHINSVNVH